MTEENQSNRYIEIIQLGKQKGEFKIELCFSLVAMGYYRTVIEILERQLKEQKKLFKTIILENIPTLVN